MLSHDQLLALHECLADETRLRILNLMISYGKPIVQRDIENTLQVTQSKIGRHFGYMKMRQAVVYEKFNQFVYATVNPDYKPIIKYILSKADSKVLKADMERFNEIKKDLYLQRLRK